jgi:integrase
MKVKANLSFTLKAPKEKIPDEDYPIYLLITIDRKVARISTGQKIKYKFWDNDEGKSISDSNLNRKLDEIRNNAHLHSLIMEKEGKVYTAADLASVIKGVKTSSTYLIPYFEDHIKGIVARNEIDHKSISRYQYTLTRLKSFLKEQYNTNDLKIKDITLRFIDEFDTYLVTKPSELNKIISRNTANGYLKKLKTIILKAHAEGEITSNPFYHKKLKNKETHVVYLTKEEINKIYNHDFSYSALLDKVRDYFIFCCLTGMRIQSVQKLNKNNISKESSILYINFIQDKVLVKNKLAVNPKIEAILKKYESSPDYQINGKLLPVISLSVLNRGIKEVASIVGINKHLHMHVGRHTFAVRYLEEGGSMEGLSKLLGHRSLRTTAIYGKITESKLSKESYVLHNIL